MRPEMFTYPVEVSKHEDSDWPFREDYSRIEILQCLNSFFGHSTLHENVFEFYKVNRPGFGIDRAITVLSNPKNEYYAIRISTKPEIETTAVVFDPAAYSKERIQQLYMALREHYPATYFLNTKHLLIILQRFVFYPVCQFVNLHEMIGLLEIIWYASKARILLDYNQNHWLVSERGHLFYVDSDFMGHVLPDRHIAFSENFNQAMVFINPDNCNVLAQVLPILATRGEDYPQFLEEFFTVLKNYLESWKTVKEVSPYIQCKLKCLTNIVNDFWSS
ncbi:MAG: hypothetical protein JSW11_15975 [Candidatus Heimdallarchaeota archaeon]|nr:MAG: hypothetical protein JSW11_15975 [Candidatus Heimdallarchaeota archaeon]